MNKSSKHLQESMLDGNADLSESTPLSSRATNRHVLSGHKGMVTFQDQLGEGSVYGSVFKVGMFIKAALYHICFPLSIPFILAIEGRVMAANMIFWGVHPLFFLRKNWHAIVVVFLHIWLCSLLYRYHYKLKEKEATVIRVYMYSIMGTIDLAYILRSLTVAFKYAYLSPFDLQRMRRVRVSTEEFQSHLLLYWANPSADTVLREIKRAAYRLGIQLTSRVGFTYQPRAEERLRMAMYTSTNGEHCGLCTQVEMGNGHLPGLLVVASIALRACQEALVKLPGSVRAIGYGAAGAQVLVPIIVRLQNGSIPVFWGSVYNRRDLAHVSEPQIIPAPLISPVIFIWAVVFWHYMANLITYVLVGILHYQRRYLMLRKMTALVSEGMSENEYLPQELPHEPVVVRHEPLVYLNSEHNIANWLKCRQILKTFGLSYQRRIEVIASCLLLAMLGFTAFAVLSEVQGGGRYIDSDIALGFLLSYSFAITCVGLLLIINYGRKANLQSKTGQEALLRLRVNLKQYVRMEKGQCTICGRVITESTLGVLASASGDSWMCPKCRGVDLVDVLHRHEGQPEDTADDPLKPVERETERLSLTEERIDSLLGTVAGLLELDDSERPVTVFGVRTDAALFRAIFTAAVSVFSLSFRQVVTHLGL